MIHTIKPLIKTPLKKIFKKPQHKAHKKRTRRVLQGLLHRPTHRKIFKIVLTLLKL